MKQQRRAEVQNRERAAVRRSLWRLLSLTTCSEQGHLERDAQDHVQSDSKHFQEWRVHSIPGQLVPVFDYSCCKRIFLVFIQNALFQLVSVAPHPVSGRY